MRQRLRQPNITVIWEPLPNADPQAIHKAFAMLFRHAEAGGEIQETAGACGEQHELDKTH